MTWEFLESDELFYQVQFQYPKWFLTKMHKAQEALVKDLMAYFETPHEQWHGDACFVKEMENEMRALKLSTYDTSILMVTVY